MQLSMTTINCILKYTSFRCIPADARDRSAPRRASIVRETTRRVAATRPTGLRLDSMVVREPVPGWAAVPRAMKALEPCDWILAFVFVPKFMWRCMLGLCLG